MEKAALKIRALNHKLRQSILDLIGKNVRMNVTDIYIKLRLEQSAASQHLAILRKAGFVKTERYGKFIYYSLDKQEIKRVNDLIKKIAA